MEIGIVGLPNVGKSTIFNALTSGSAAASNYPFTTIEPNIGVVAVPIVVVCIAFLLLSAKGVLAAEGQAARGRQGDSRYDRQQRRPDRRTSRIEPGRRRTDDCAPLCFLVPRRPGGLGRRPSGVRPQDPHGEEGSLSHPVRLVRLALPGPYIHILDVSFPGVAFFDLKFVNAVDQ